MNLILRTLLVTLRALWALARGRTLEPFGVSVIPFHVWVNDLDVNLHMNNGRYLTIMDLGRFDFILRAGVWKAMRRGGWMALIGAATIRYKRSLAPFQRYRLETRVLGWDDKWFYIEQRFVRGDELCAIGVVRGLFRGREGNVPTGDVLRAAGHAVASPPLGPVTAAWAELERVALVP